MYHLANGILTLRVVQPPSSWTGRPNWGVPANPTPPFTRDGITIPRYAWHTNLAITAACTPDPAQPAFCAGDLPPADRTCPRISDARALLATRRARQAALQCVDAVEAA